MTTILSTMKTTTSFSRIAQLVCGSQILIWGAQGAGKAFYSQYYCGHTRHTHHKIDVVKNKKIVIKAGVPANTDVDFAKRIMECATARGFPEDFVAQGCRQIKDEKLGGTCSACTVDHSLGCNCKLPHYRFQIQLKSKSRSDTSCILTLDIRTDKTRRTHQPYIYIAFEKMPDDDVYGNEWGGCPKLSVPQILHRVFKAQPRYAQYQTCWCFLSCFCCGRKSKCNTGNANCISFVKIMHQAVVVGPKNPFEAFKENTFVANVGYPDDKPEASKIDDTLSIEEKVEMMLSAEP